jgi:dienelactone hydrolase
MGEDIDPMQTEPAENQHKRAQLMRLLGGFTPSSLQIIARAAYPSPDATIRVEHLTLKRADGALIRAYLTGPEGEWSACPAVLYAHAHGNRYEIGAAELIEGRPALLAPPYGIALAKAGFVTLALDLPCFGNRAALETESAAAKRALWHGKTLFGAMLEDLAGGLTLLTQMDGVDASRISLFGVSMGATLAMWLVALEPRIHAVAHLICFADLASLIETGAHDLHGQFMTVPGLIPAFTTGEIAGLVAPRPQWVGVGLADPLTPLMAVEKAARDARNAYECLGAGEAFHLFISQETEHIETPRMREGVLDFLKTQNFNTPPR